MPKIRSLRSLKVLFFFFVMSCSEISQLANYLHNDLDNPSANIDTWLGVPVEAVCGDYRVRVIENQRYFNRWVSFQ